MFKSTLKDVFLVCLLLVGAMGVLTLCAGCATVPTSPDSGSSRTYTESNPYAPGTVAWRNDAGNWEILPPPPLVFTGVTATGLEIQIWAREQGITARGVFGDTKYAQLESQSAIANILWLKAFLRDTGYDYIDDTRDCNHFASAARAFPSLLADKAPAAPAVFEIWAQMRVSFAGVTDGYHALNAAWTDKGVPVFEPQGSDLVYQDIRAWPNKSGITQGFGN